MTINTHFLKIPPGGTSLKVVQCGKSNKPKSYCIVDLSFMRTHIQNLDVNPPCSVYSV